MITIETYLARLKLERTEYTASALTNPTARDAFEYGFKSGTVHGLDRALQLIEKMLNEEDTHERELEARLDR